MDSATRTRLHDLTLEARRILMEDARGLLEGIYGLHRTGCFEPAERLPAVQAMPEVAETRGRLEQYLADEAAAGLPQPQAVEQLVKEVAFTHLNRLVAFKMLEARKLIYGTLDRFHNANGFLRYLADPAHALDYARYQAGDLPRDLLGEGPRDSAYRHFLLWQSARIAREIKVLFDPDNLPSRLFPRPRALRDLLNLLNAPEVAEAWAPESDETVGWVYQHFNEQEKAEVFERLYKKKQKIQTADVPAASQLFTPRWIVKFLVHNTLGRAWMQMHPDSRLRDSLEYLVPLDSEIPPVPLKPVRELIILDPACGTMHFGLVAFDLLVEMYREELEMAGQPGWPEEPSVAGNEDIPAAIIKSGALITTDFAAEQGRDVFAVPGSILSASSAGPNELLKDGAKPVTGADDVLSELNLVRRAAQVETRRALPENADERAMLRLLADDPTHINDLGHASGLPMAQIGSLLLLMELKGLVRQIGAGQYVRA